MHLTVPDGRENPLSWALSAAVPSSQPRQVAKGDARYEKVYYPCVAEDAALPAAMVISIGAIAHANRIVVEQVGGRVHVARCEVVEFVPSVSSLDKWADQLVERVGPALESTRERGGALVASGMQRAGSGAALASQKIMGAWASFTRKG